ncbi:MAG: TolB family protein [Terriglobia bacterium]
MPRSAVLVLLGIAGAAVLLLAQAQVPLALPEEVHLRNVRQLTFGGENAEAYFSPDNRWLIFQAHAEAQACDQIYVMDTAGGKRRRVSTGRGRTTCGYFFPDGQRILYSSTHHADRRCPPRPDYSRGYVWALDPNYDIFTAQPDGSELRPLTTTPGYDAEATIARAGRIVFTSTRDADLEIYTMNPDGSDLRRLTHRIGYDGGAVFSPAGGKIAWRAQYPTNPEEIGDYQALLSEGLVRPSRLELWVMDADGANKRQLTHNGAANFAPAFHPDGERIIFASNLHDPQGRNFDLYLINVDGSGLERVTYHSAFDAFPMFSSDAKKLVWASNRQQRVRGETNIFIADWVK